ncbi:hypothetical protein [Paenibacillus sp. M2]|uniref:DUF6414 family protein n=1 Tax=Paenibacillus sp. M2 TaxID=3341793 RepID=UPI003988E002
MKELIYLDTGFLHSFLAQSNEGLPISTNTELQESESRTKTDEIKRMQQHQGDTEVSSGEIDLAGLFKTPSAKGRYRLTNRKTTGEALAITQLDAGKEIISKQLHDNALTEFESYLEDNGMIHDTADNVGTYVKIKGEFSIVSLDFMKNILNPEYTSQLFKIFTESEIDEKIVGIEALAIQDSKKKSMISAIRKEAQKDKESQEKMLQGIGHMISYTSSLFPSDTFIRIGSYIMPIKNENLRETSSALTFKYGSNSEIELTVLGKFTRVYTTLAPNTMDSGNTAEMMEGISTIVDGFIGEMGIVKRGDFIISPIAIYFE